MALASPRPAMNRPPGDGTTLFGGDEGAAGFVGALAAFLLHPFQVTRKTSRERRVEGVVRRAGGPTVAEDAGRFAVVGAIHRLGDSNLLPPADVLLPFRRAGRSAKPLYQRLIPRTMEGGFALKTLRAPGFECPWHAHPECELVLVQRSNGYRIVGDDIAAITPGDLVLLGPDVPHIWKHDPETSDSPGVEAILLQFDAGLLGERIMALPALTSVRRLIERAARGLHFTGPTQAIVADRLSRMRSMAPFPQFIEFLEILGLLADSAHSQPLVSPGWASQSLHFDQERMNRVLTFIHGSYDQRVRLRDAARVVNLSESAFSRFFRLHAGKTFPDFVNELRIGRACRLLIETDKTVTEISYECGFSNLSNFNRQFLRAKRISPRAFRRQIQPRLESDASVPEFGP